MNKLLLLHFTDIFVLFYYCIPSEKETKNLKNIPFHTEHVKRNVQRVSIRWKQLRFLAKIFINVQDRWNNKGPKYLIKTCLISIRFLGWIMMKQMWRNLNSVPVYPVLSEFFRKNHAKCWVSACFLVAFLSKRRICIAWMSRIPPFTNVILNNFCLHTYLRL